MDGRTLRRKGVEHALDPICDSLNFVASGIGEWLHDGWDHSYPVGRCNHRVSGPTYSGTKNIVAIWTLAGEGEVFGKGVLSRLGNISSNLLIPSRASQLDAPRESRQRTPALE